MAPHPRRDGETACAVITRNQPMSKPQLGQCRRTDKTGSFNALVRLTFEQLQVGRDCGRLGDFARLALQVYKFTGRCKSPQSLRLLCSLPPTLDHDHA